MYNYKKIEYPNGQTQVRIYENSIYDGKFISEIDENGVFKYTYEEKSVDRTRKTQGERTQEEEDRCMKSSANRSKMNLCELTRANEWQWFITLTYDPESVDSLSFEESRKRVTKWFNNLRARKCPNVKYIGVPEKHKSGRWHFHILCSDIDEIANGFTQAFNQKTGKPIKDVYNMNLEWKYGYNTVSRVKDTKRASTYIMKYITKDMMRDSKEKHRFFIVTT